MILAPQARNFFGYILALSDTPYPPPPGVGGCPENIPENDLGNTKHSGKYPYGSPYLTPLENLCE